MHLRGHEDDPFTAQDSGLLDDVAVAHVVYPLACGTVLSAESGDRSDAFIYRREFQRHYGMARISSFDTYSWWIARLPH